MLQHSLSHLTFLSFSVATKTNMMLQHSVSHLTFLSFSVATKTNMMLKHSVLVQVQVQVHSQSQQGSRIGDRNAKQKAVPRHSRAGA
jgi:hypothetical protein